MSDEPNADRRNQIIRLLETRDDHGTYACYGAGCRCEDCRSAKRDYGHAYRQRNRALCNAQARALYSADAKTRNARRRALYAENRLHVAAVRKAHRLRRREILARFKLLKGCADCGFRPSPTKLHFHHRDPSAKDLQHQHERASPQVGCSQGRGAEMRRAMRRLPLRSARGPRVTPDRWAQIIALLTTRDDHLPPTPTRRDHSTSGFVHNAPARTTCEDCLANGRTMPDCETCGGRGYTEETHTRDPYAIDKIQPYGIDWIGRVERERERVAQDARLKAQLQPPFATDADELANTNPYPWETARRRMYRDYDYATLDHHLDQLRLADEGAYHALHAAYIYGWAEPSTGYQHAVNRGLHYLDQHLPNPLRAPGDAKHPALERRDRKTAA